MGRQSRRWKEKRQREIDREDLELDQKKAQEDQENLNHLRRVQAYLYCFILQRKSDRPVSSQAQDFGYPSDSHTVTVNPHDTLMPENRGTTGHVAPPMFDSADMDFIDINNTSGLTAMDLDTNNDFQLAGSSSVCSTGMDFLGTIDDAHLTTTNSLFLDDFAHQDGSYGSYEGEAASIDPSQFDFDQFDFSQSDFDSLADLPHYS